MINEIKESVRGLPLRASDHLLEYFFRGLHTDLGFNLIEYKKFEGMWLTDVKCGLSLFTRTQLSCWGNDSLINNLTQMNRLDKILGETLPLKYRTEKNLLQAQNPSSFYVVEYMFPVNSENLSLMRRAVLDCYRRINDWDDMTLDEADKIKKILNGDKK